MKIPPIFPLPPNRVWRSYFGGKVLDIREGKKNPADSQFPEDWIASTTVAVNKGREAMVEEGLSVVTFNGTHHLLRDLMTQHPDQLVGMHHFRKYGAHTRFLLKFLDSAIRLHLQAHPTIEFSKKHLDSDAGKTEAYVILSIREEVAHPYIYLGIQHPISSAAFQEAIVGQDIEKLLDCFEKIPIKPGDVFIVPGGMPHAIGEGVLMIEIMEPTDYAVRLEFERGGIPLPEEARFMGRDVDFALEMIDLQPKSIDRVRARHFCQPRVLNKQDGGTRYELIGPGQTPCFSVHRLEMESEFEMEEESFYVGIVTRGTGAVHCGEDRLQIREGDRFFVTYAADAVLFNTEEGLEVVITLPPD